MWDVGLGGEATQGLEELLERTPGEELRETSRRRIRHVE